MTSKLVKKKFQSRQKAIFLWARLIFVQRGTFAQREQVKDVINGKLYQQEHTPLYKNKQKRDINNPMETTKLHKIQPAWCKTVE